MSNGERTSLSQQLVAARSEKGASLEEVHRATGVSLSVLEGIEAGQYDVVEAVFTRLALGTYAAYLGLDEGVVLRAFDEEYGTTSSSIQPVYSERVDEREGTVSPSLDGGVLRVLGIVGAALAVLLLIISALDDDEDVQVVPATTSVPESTSSALVRSVASASAPIERSVRADGEEMREPRANRSEVYSADGSVGLDRALGTEDAFAEDAAVDSVNVSVDASLRADIEPALREIPAQSDWLVLQIEAVDSTWVQVRWDESGFFEAIVPPGQVYSWEARDFFTVHSGKAHGLRYTFQGEVLGNGSFGDPNRVLRFLANAEGVVLLGPDFKPLSSSLQP